ncbi:interleukin-17-4 [Elysia marginata]|uniref:Interleukin-17-4 n=1 Tax=Elysia marginata TaxID=1093978 RepID=A0AAV4F614_9GAST|nr:interleukin-17-4 [Elysia marginata]
MGSKTFIKALQVLFALTIMTVLGLLNPTQAYVIGSKTNTKVTTGQERNDHNSFRFLFGRKWRAKHLIGGADSGHGKATEEPSDVGNFDVNSRPGEGEEDKSSGMSNQNPFLRSKRDTSGNSSCEFLANLPQEVQQLNSSLNDSVYVGLIPQQDSFIPLPSNQSLTCPNSTDPWWPGNEINLRSTCPYINKVHNLGTDAYPRYLVQAQCLCSTCVGQNINRCQEIRRSVTIFRRQGYQNGLALMKKEQVLVTVGCLCAAPEPNSGSSGNSEMDAGIPYLS